MRELRSTPPALIICVAALPPQPPVVPADLTPPPPPIYTLPSPSPPHAIAIQQADLSTLLVFFLLSPRALKMMPHQSTSLDLGLSLGGLASQGSLSSSTTTTSGAISPWAAALTSVVGDVTARRDAHTHAPQHLQAAMDPDHRGAMRASTSPDSAAALSSGASGGDNTSNSKRDRDLLERTGSGGVRSDEEDAADGAGGRKKLRLSKDQAAVLEECFKTHSTLNPKQKVALANRLGLRPRQVEVWFQNRRARTKLKQTEVDCEYLKRWCERLADENKRLEKELADLRALKAAAPSAAAAAAQPASASPAATLTMCPSCRRVAAANHHHQQQQQCHPKSSNAPTPAVAGGGVVPSHCQFFPAAVDRTGQSTWNAAAAPLVTRELF